MGLLHQRSCSWRPHRAGNTEGINVPAGVSRPQHWGVINLNVSGDYPGKPLTGEIRESSLAFCYWSRDNKGVQG